MGCRSQPMSRGQLRVIARQFRKLLGIDDVLHVNVMKILELVMPTMFEGFSYEIVQHHELPKNRHADTDVVNRIIRIREDVYEKAYQVKEDTFPLQHLKSLYYRLEDTGNYNRVKALLEK